jgi:DNA-binding transcriptional LysR family regulator
MRSGASGLVRIGVMLVAAIELMPRVVARLAQEEPMPRLVLQEDIMQGLWPRICGAELDLIVGRLDDRVRASSFHHETLYDDKHCITVRPGHALARTAGLGGDASAPMGAAAREHRVETRPHGDLPRARPARPAAESGVELLDRDTGDLAKQRLHRRDVG